MKELEKRDLHPGNVICEVDGYFTTLGEVIGEDTSYTSFTLKKEVGEFLTFIPDEEPDNLNPAEITKAWGITMSTTDLYNVSEDTHNPLLKGKQMWVVEDDSGYTFRKEITIKLRRWNTEYGKIEEGQFHKGRTTETISYSKPIDNNTKIIDKFLTVNGVEIY